MRRSWLQIQLLVYQILNRAMLHTWQQSKKWSEQSELPSILHSFLLSKKGHFLVSLLFHCVFTIHSSSGRQLVMRFSCCRHWVWGSSQAGKHDAFLPSGGNKGIWALYECILNMYENSIFFIVNQSRGFIVSPNLISQNLTFKVRIMFQSS